MSQLLIVMNDPFYALTRELWTILKGKKQLNDTHAPGLKCGRKAPRIKLKYIIILFFVGYSKGMERIINEHIRNWCEKGQVMALDASKKLAFETTARMLLGCEFSQAQMNTMMSCMTTMVDNFFTLPVDLPGFGFHKVRPLTLTFHGIDWVCLLLSQVFQV